MKDIANSLFEPINQRLKNQFFGSIALSWMLVNWKAVFIILFSSKTIEDKLIFIANEYYYSTWYNIFFYMLFPVLLAVIYSLLILRIENLFDSINKPVKLRKFNFMYDLDVDAYIKKKDLVIKEKEIEDIKSGFLEVQTLNQKIEMLSNQLDEKNNLIVDYEKKIPEQQNSFDHIRGIWHSEKEEYENKIKLLEENSAALDRTNEKMYQKIIELEQRSN